MALKEMRRRMAGVQPATKMTGVMKEKTTASNAKEHGTHQLQQPQTQKTNGYLIHGQARNFNSKTN